MREQTEWVELLDLKANVLVGSDFDKIIKNVNEKLGKSVVEDQFIYGGGKASEKIVNQFLAEC